MHILLPDGRRVCQSTRCTERAEAEAFVVRLQSESLRDPGLQALGSFAWPQAVVRYLEECAEKKSLPDDRDHLRKLEPYLRLHRLDAVDMSALQPFIRDRKEKDEVRNATINRALEIVRRILNLAHQDWRWIRAVPKIRMLKEPRRRVRFLRRDEATRLLESMPKHMKPIVRFALSTGCRASEILGLEWNRVDLTRKVAWLDHGATKSGDGRGIPLNSDAIAALQSTFGQHPRWCFTFGGKRIQKSSSAWDVQSGTSLPELMELGGWKSYEMVLRYAHLAPEKLSSVASRIEWEPSQRRDTPDNEAGVPAATFPLRSTN